MSKRQYSRRRNALNRRKQTQRRTKRNTRSKNQRRRRTGGESTSIYNPMDFFDPTLDSFLERSMFTDARNDATEEQINRMRVASLRYNLEKRIRENPDHPRVGVWNRLLEESITNNNAEIRKIASNYDNARSITGIGSIMT